MAKEPHTHSITSEQQFLIDLWDEHLRDEFTTRDTNATLDTMTPDAYVNHIPVPANRNGLAGQNAQNMEAQLDKFR